MKEFCKSLQRGIKYKDALTRCNSLCFRTNGHLVLYNSGTKFNGIYNLINVHEMEHYELEFIKRGSSPKSRSI